MRNRSIDVFIASSPRSRLRFARRLGAPPRGGNTGKLAGFRALPGSTTYAATKAAVRALMEGYGWELRRHGIATTTINPGFVVSEMTAHNQFRMPFLVPTDIAAGKIAQAIERRRRSYTFPWPMACLAHLLPFIPGAILGRLTPPERPSSV